MKVILKKDIVIPKGTVFSDAPTKTVRCSKGHIQTTFALSKDSFGTINYDLDDIDNLRDHFDIVETGDNK